MVRLVAGITRFLVQAAPIFVRLCMYLRRGDLPGRAFRVPADFDDRFLWDFSLLSSGGPFLEVSLRVSCHASVCRLHLFLGLFRGGFCHVECLLIVVRGGLLAGGLICGGADQLVDPLVFFGVEQEVQRWFLCSLRRVVRVRF